MVSVRVLPITQILKSQIDWDCHRLTHRRTKKVSYATEKRERPQLELAAQNCAEDEMYGTPTPQPILLPLCIKADPIRLGQNPNPGRTLAETHPCCQFPRNYDTVLNLIPEPASKLRPNAVANTSGG